MGTISGERKEEEEEGATLSSKLCGELQAALRNGRYWMVEAINYLNMLFLAGSREKIVSAMYRATALLICTKGTVDTTV